jgi:hypothetical protein
MSLQVQHFPISIPASTPVTTPQVSQMQLGTFTVDWVEVETPDGANGDVGFYIAASNQQYLPFRTGAAPIWVRSNNSVKHWDATDWPTSGDWQLYAYNLGGFPHLLQVTWAVSLTDDTVTTLSALVPVPVDSLSSQ